MSVSNGLDDDLGNNSNLDDRIMELAMDISDSQTSYDTVETKLTFTPHWNHEKAFILGLAHFTLKNGQSVSKGIKGRIVQLKDLKAGKTQSLSLEIMNLPLGFELDQLTYHFYSRGLEIPTDQSTKRKLLTEEETIPEPADDLDDIPEAGQKMIRKKWHTWIMKNEQREKIAQGYLASMTFADAMVGRLIAALESGPMVDNTIVALWSDHGYHLGSKNHWEKFALWNEATHVPLVFLDRRNGIHDTSEAWEMESRSNQPVNLLDLYPTLVELCDLPDPGHLEGVSLVPLLKDPDYTTNRAVVTIHRYMNHAVRSERWRYIRYKDGSEELYDHSVDPREYDNLAKISQYSEVKDQLAQWLPKINIEPIQKPED